MVINNYSVIYSTQLDVQNLKKDNNLYLCINNKIFPPVRNLVMAIICDALGIASNNTFSLYSFLHESGTLAHWPNTLVITEFQTCNSCVKCARSA